MSSEKGRMFSHLKWKDRLKIEKMLKEKKSKSEIARTLRVDYTTVMREIKRGLTIQRDTNLVDREGSAPPAGWPKGRREWSA